MNNLQSYMMIAGVAVSVLCTALVVTLALTLAINKLWRKFLDGKELAVVMRRYRQQGDTYSESKSLVMITGDESEDYLVTFPNHPEAITQGDTLGEALINAADALEEALAGE